MSSYAHSFSPGGSYSCPEPERLIKSTKETVLTAPTVLGTQVGGTHYTDCAIQPIEYIWANGLGFSEGNIVKYVTRWKSKGGIKDLEKARHHISLLIERAEKDLTWPTVRKSCQRLSGAITFCSTWFR
jgi:hypothetical protein